MSNFKSPPAGVKKTVQYSKVKRIIWEFSEHEIRDALVKKHGIKDLHKTHVSYTFELCEPLEGEWGKAILTVNYKGKEEEEEITE